MGHSCCCCPCYVSMCSCFVTPELVCFCVEVGSSFSCVTLRAISGYCCCCVLCHNTKMTAIHSPLVHARSYVRILRVVNIRHVGRLFHRNYFSPRATAATTIPPAVAQSQQNAHLVCLMRCWDCLQGAACRPPVAAAGDANTVSRIIAAKDEGQTKRQELGAL